jgi:hypothetical protein
VDITAGHSLQIVFRQFDIVPLGGGDRHNVRENGSEGGFAGVVLRGHGPYSLGSVGAEPVEADAAGHSLQIVFR